ncbi:MAG: DUF115 domain-containing protein [Spirochaetes bacterium]|nr:DUF115 domain-containing protein [Spirochaetota bacterium]
MNRILDRNLLALSSNTPSLADRISAADPDPSVSIEMTRSGLPVPVVSRSGGARFWLHSAFDPAREATRMSENSAARGFIVFFGLGAGYHIQSFLKGERCSAALVVDFGISTIRTLLESVDMANVLADRRVSLLVDPEDEELSSFLKGKYVPVLFGDLSTVIHRPCVELRDGDFGRAADVLKDTVSQISADYSVQAFFGKRWFLNIVRNLPVAERPVRPLPPIREAIITAAGPSLEAGLAAIAARGRDTFLIATDTSWPVLRRSGILPDAVVSIDCQHISYYHFFGRLPCSAPLVLDLASPHVLTKRADSLMFFSSGHPFCRFIAEHWKPFPLLDTSGGNVSYAAASFAETLGAVRATIYGADFSYPMGKSYARGTYIYPYFEYRSDRLKPVESLFQSFMFRNQLLERIPEPDGRFRYETEPLSRYRVALERFERKSPMEIVSIPRHDGRSCGPARPDEKNGARRDMRLFSSGRTSSTSERFLAGYRDMVAAFPSPSGGQSDYLRRLAPMERDILTTLLPAASAIKRSTPRRAETWSELVEETRRWTLEILDSAISPG